MVGICSLLKNEFELNINENKDKVTIITIDFNRLLLF